MGKILVIDDNIDELEFARRALIKVSKEYEVLGVQTGKEACELYCSHHDITLVICDTDLKGENGPTVCYELRGLGYKGPVLATSTASTDAVWKEAERLDGKVLANLFVEKGQLYHHKNPMIGGIVEVLLRSK